MEKQFELSLIEALCIVENLWENEKEKELFDYAKKVIESEGKKINLKYQIFILNNKLELLDGKNNS